MEMFSHEEHWSCNVTLCLDDAADSIKGATFSFFPCVLLFVAALVAQTCQRLLVIF